jgi:hypothetical protein
MSEAYSGPSVNCSEVLQMVRWQASKSLSSADTRMVRRLRLDGGGIGTALTRYSLRLSSSNGHVLLQ